MASPASLIDQGIAALKAGDFARARAALAAACDVDPVPRALLLLAQACARDGDAAAEDAALDRLLAIDPRHPAAMAVKGDRAVARGDDRAAGAWYATLVGHARDQPELAGLVRHAEAALAGIKARFEAHLRAAIDESTAGARFEEAIAILDGKAEPQLQRPASFYYPGLAQTAFFDPSAFDWVRALEAAAPAIRAELDAVVATRAGFRPYVEDDRTRPRKTSPLLEDANWSAFHFFDRGEPIADRAARCPGTLAALARLPLPRIAGRAPMALFSLLEPRTHIPPHHGLLNTRLIVHLPLIVPVGCRLRVGNHVRTVEAGKVMIFDDSIEHEAWNDSDETRVVLITEIWRPELDAGERAALTRLFAAIGTYGEG